MAKLCCSKREREKGTKELIVVVVVPTERVQHNTTLQYNNHFVILQSSRIQIEREGRRKRQASHV